MAGTIETRQVYMHAGPKILQLREIKIISTFYE